MNIILGVASAIIGTVACFLIWWGIGIIGDAEGYKYGPGEGEDG